MPNFSWTCSCPDNVREALTDASIPLQELFDLVSSIDKLCQQHGFVKRIYSLVLVGSTVTRPDASPEDNLDTTLSNHDQHYERLSDTEHPSKRPRLDGPPPFSTPRHIGFDISPLHDRERDEGYRTTVLGELRKTSFPKNSHGSNTSEYICKLVALAEPPNEGEASFCTGDEATILVESTPDHNSPIFTKGQQPFQWTKGDRPIVQFLRRIALLDKMVSVQVPSRPITEESYEPRQLSEIRDLFLANKPSDDPVNLLDLHNPLTCTVPYFLTGENCQLLSQVRDTILNEYSAERIVASKDQWNQWRNVLEGALLSQGGHTTTVHEDGPYATWLTVQEGLVGVGWMAHPTDQERNEWREKPTSYTGGRWRYVVLEPGWSIFFYPGTIHFVFRARARQTLSFTGHILQWSGIERWMHVVLVQMKNPSITNEDVKLSAPQLVRAVSTLVKARKESGEVELAGGETAIRQFFELLELFERTYNQSAVPTEPPRKKKFRARPRH